MSRPEALRLLAEAPVFRLAGVGEDGEPVLRTLHGVVVDRWLCFHGAPAGEKTSLVGRKVVACVEEEVARVPSYFLDPERACPATTLFRSVQVHGVLEPLEEPALRARALQGLMEKLQPEGGHRPITAQEPLYAPQLKGLLVAGLPLERLDGKAKLAQNRSPAERARLLEQLWARGGPGDARAVELVREGNPGLDAPFLAAPAGLRLHPWLPPSRAAEAAALLEDAYWNGEFGPPALAQAHLGSSAWVGATGEDGRLVGSARALADGAKYAWVYDVVVAPPLRGRGLGKALLRLLLDHPAVRGARRVLLATKDAQALYARFGFIPTAEAPPRPFPSTQMVLVRPGPG